ncbi:D-amino-acid transaminase [Ammoniphilus sp. CFH 90114]|uniref:D-amino-acid transaminase n=1 Tax=Ammoniphilus sp. CFH 90114 TaxID=2493665 RepID=UPI00100EBEA5|nr:D-amino-acid transaminase [Ammoniphilus sp. CFH 90114]RXT07878.1 D-amino-acid transaminase [Ammoniphilus sp. CFH 90114]
MILLNDRFIEDAEDSINIEDRGYQFGDGVYEVIRVYNGGCFRLNAHIHRLEQSASKIKMTLPFSSEEVSNRLLELVKRNGLQDGNIYIQVTRGVAPRTHHFPYQSTPVVVAYTQETKRPIEQNKHGIKAILSEDIRWHRCDIKSLNLLGNVLAKQAAKESGCEEAILHRGNIVSEGSSTNVFIVKNELIYTHPANNLILEGITRAEVFRLAREITREIIEEPISVKELLNADEVFVTSTTMEIAPVIQVDQEVIGNGSPGPVTQMLQKVYEHQVMLSSKGTINK